MAVPLPDRGIRAISPEAAEYQASHELAMQISVFAGYLHAAEMLAPMDHRETMDGLVAAAGVAGGAALGAEELVHRAADAIHPKGRSVVKAIPKAGSAMLLFGEETLPYIAVAAGAVMAAVALFKAGRRDIEIERSILIRILDDPNLQVPLLKTPEGRKLIIQAIDEYDKAHPAIQAIRHVERGGGRLTSHAVRKVKGALQLNPSTIDIPGTDAECFPIIASPFIRLLLLYTKMSMSQFTRFVTPGQRPTKAQKEEWKAFKKELVAAFAEGMQTALSEAKALGMAA